MVSLLRNWDSTPFVDEGSSMASSLCWTSRSAITNRTVSAVISKVRLPNSVAGHRRFIKVIRHQGVASFRYFLLHPRNALMVLASSNGASFATMSSMLSIRSSSRPQRIHIP